MKPRSSIVSEGVLIFNDRGKVVVASPGSKRLFGYKREEFVDLSVQHVFADGLSLIDDYQSVQQNTQTGEWRIVEGVNKAGEIFQVKIGLSQFAAGSETFTIAFIKPADEGLEANVEKQNPGLVALLANLEVSNARLQEQIKKRKDTEQRLLMFQRLYDTMVHNFPDGVIGILNRDMQYILLDGKELNEIDLPALGLNSHKANSHDPILAQDTIGKIKEAFDGVDVSFEVTTKDRSYNITAVPLPDTENRINEILCVLKNVTEKNNAERALLNALERERELGELKSRFVTMACHEFKNPLATILSSTFLLENYSGQAYDNEKSLHSNRIRRSVNNLNTILNEFLLIESQNGDDVKIVPAVIDVPGYFGDFLSEVELLTKDRQIIEYQHLGEESLFDMDQHLLWSILTNLVSNGLKYSKQGEKIHVITEIKHGLLTIRVKDHGIGIPEKEHQYVFERFHRAPNALNYDGTGLGLHIVKKNVNLLKGTVSFISELDKGTEFTVILPPAKKVLTNM